jgi:hypothetical protein
MIVIKILSLFRYAFSKRPAFLCFFRQLINTRLEYYDVASILNVTIRHQNEMMFVLHPNKIIGVLFEDTGDS